MKWQKESLDLVLVEEISNKYKLSRIEASVLIRRGIARGKEILFFIEDDFIYLHQPFLFKDMEIAVDRIKDAQENQEIVLVYGDKDVDGITSTTIMVQTLQEHGIQTIWRVPLGDLGYGLSKQDIDFAQQQQVTLIITIDCGISCLSECNYARELGIDVLIVDHHTPDSRLPDAVAIIDPKVTQQQYPFDGLCAAAIAQKLRLALQIADSDFYNQDFILINTIPMNGAYKTELLCVRNLVIQWRKFFVFSEDNKNYQIDDFLVLLEGKNILIFNEKTQIMLLRKIISNNIDVYCQDLQPLVDKHFPKLKKQSLLSIMNIVRLTRYFDKELEEIDIFYQIYISVIYAEYPELKQSFTEVSDLAAIATVADLMPLQNENRIIYKIGAKKLNNNPRRNINILLEKLRLTNPISSKTIGWNIAPIINSSGRMGQADIAVTMLLAEDPTITANNAEKLIQLNQERRSTMNKLKKLIQNEIESSLEKNEHYALVFSKDLPHAFTGLVAGNYARQYGIPIIILAKRGDNIINGSIRCPATFNATTMVHSLKSYLLDGGGHRGAAGFSLLVQDKETFVDELDIYMKNHALKTDSSDNYVDVDIEIPEKHFNHQDLTAMQKKFEPFGQSWPIIQLLIPHLKIKSCKTIGHEQEHIKLIVQIGNQQIPALLWQYKQVEASLDDFMRAKTINMVVVIKTALFAGIEQFSLVIQDWEFEN